MSGSTTGDACAYIYEPLESPQHIRLMTLEPAMDPSAPLRFTFSQANYQSLHGIYEALSYTWGEPRLLYPLQHIGVETAYLHVTKNLDGALRRLRYKSRYRLLWVDAVSIHQDNDEEKSSQIPLMAEIFRGASRVVAWLGFVGPDSNEEKGMQFLERMSRQWRHVEEEAAQRRRDSKTIQYDPLDVDVKANADSVIALCSLPWFQRLWIIQEAVANHELALLTTKSQLSWTRFVSGLRLIQTTAAWRVKAGGRRNIHAITDIMNLWTYHSGLGGSHEDTDFLTLMQKFSYFGCSDARDRIFALYNLSSGIVSTTETLTEWDGLPHRSESGKISIRPRIHGHGPIEMNVDYSKSIKETYEAFTMACLTCYKGFHTAILRALLLRQHEPPALDFPSWVVDWRKEPKGSVVEPSGLEFRHRFSDGTIELNASEDPVGWPGPSLPFIDRKIAWSAEHNGTQFLLAVIELVQQVCPTSKSSRRPEVLAALRVLLQDFWPDLDGINRRSARLRKAFDEHVWPLWCGAVPLTSSSTGLSDPAFDSVHGASVICVFTASGSAPESDFVIGTGNAALQVGDHLFPYAGLKQHNTNSNIYPHRCAALILRRTPEADPGRDTPRPRNNSPERRYEMFRAESIGAPPEVQIPVGRLEGSASLYYSQAGVKHDQPFILRRRRLCLV